MNQSRLSNLDYLRGLAAAGIMFFHYLSWTLGRFDANTVVGRIGVYGVSIFYILSGLTLWYVYRNKLNNAQDLSRFFTKRALRIFPLLWIATIASVLLTVNGVDMLKLVLNLTGLFGLVDWNGYYATGAWSIGNELVFYLFFPVFIMLARRSKILFWGMGVLLFALYIYFAFYKIDASKSIQDQWKDYVNPLNQVFLFFSGFCVGELLTQKNISNKISIAAIAAGLLLFIAWPAYGNPVQLISGVNRLVFTLAVLLISIGFFKLKITLPALIDKPLSMLGEASYSVYLLHPIVFSLVSMAKFSPLINFGISSLVTLVISYLNYITIEKFFMKLGKRKDANTVNAFALSSDRKKT